jgi:hypothetical protein
MKKTTSSLGILSMGLLVLAATVPAEAGEPARSMAALEERVKPGTDVDVVDRQGRILRGGFARADDEGVLVTPYGSAEGRRIAASDVMSVTSTGDSLKNGALIGAAVGALGAIGFAAGLEDPYDPYAPPACSTTGCKVGMSVASVAVWTGIGVLVDRAIKGREVVYRAPVERVSWSVTPHPAPRGAGLQVALKF